MTYRLAAVLLSATTMMGACTTIDDLPEERVGSATLRTAQGLPAGTVQLLRNNDTVTVTVAAVGLQPGEHGFHLHTTGECRAPDFASAGGHLNPGNNTHGSLSTGGKHLGDLPNLVVGANRTASAQIDLDGSADTVLSQIFDADGAAVVIHAGPDDYVTDPAGDAGSRVACGVLQPA
ncbi:superoxide dismutase family protein [Qipengyuania sp. XHP0207]|uniref:superoxide dismutase family protein n=1 Tax=Qipengyuania sp. XHP0207 TaxID=3038078 RepID=UPI00241EAD16|nr:superoxide dismutase family protein [Qipengyuania sp. XHP0207]MDG5748236.1 superoxide dismutase family protein [Qipengyuania sp. XHP0207]